MLTRVVAVMLLASAGIVAEAMSYSFVCKASGRLGRPIRFEFYRDATLRPKTDIRSFTVSIRTADDRWKAMWSISSGHADWLFRVGYQCSRWVVVPTGN